MDRIVTLLLLLVSAILLVPGCIAEEQATTDIVPEVNMTEEAAVAVPAYNMTADMNITALNMTPQQVVLVSLPENPTTGFTWNVTLSEGLTLLNETYIQDAAPEGMAGVGGVHEWFVQAVTAGEQTFSGIEKQAWENETGNETTYSLNILVE